MLQYENFNSKENFDMRLFLKESLENTANTLKLLKLIEQNYYYIKIKEIISKNYDLGTVKEVYEIFGGTVNRNFAALIEKDNTTKLWFVRQYVEDKEIKEILYEHNLLKHIRQNGFDINSLPATAKTGETYIIEEIGGRESSTKCYFAISEFLPGDDTYNWERNNVTKTACASAAKTIANFHSAACDFNPPAEWGGNEPIIWEQLKMYGPNIHKYVGVLKEDKNNAIYTDYVGSKLDYLDKTIAKLLKIFDKDEELVKTVIHSDLHPGNFKYQDEKVVGMFDFDWPKRDVRLYEVAISALFFTASWECEKNGVVDFDLLKLFIKSYNNAISKTNSAIGPLNDTEIEYFPEMMMIGSLYVTHFCIGKCYNDKNINIFEYFYYTQHQMRCVEWIDEHIEEVKNICKNI